MKSETSSRIESLPDDLRAIAKDMLSEKFDEIDDRPYVMGVDFGFEDVVIQKPRQYGRSEHWRRMAEMFKPKPIPKEELTDEKMNLELTPQWTGVFGIIAE